jgi:hypothetical protein
MTVTYQVAMAAGRDAGNRSMREANRTEWNDTDWNTATKTTEQLLMTIDDKTASQT